MTETIAILGAGLLGSGFVQGARSRGVNVNVWNRTHAKAQALESTGARAFAQASDAVRGVSRVHLVVADDAAVEAILVQIATGLAKDTVVIDHSTTLPRTTAERVTRLAREGIRDGVQLVGDVMLDLALAAREPALCMTPPDGLSSGDFFVTTLHRASNTDDPDRLRFIIEQLRALSDTVAPVLLPVHPRLRASLASAGTWISSRRLPLSCTTRVTTSRTSSDASGSGQGARARLCACPSRCQSSSARWGASGASSSTRTSAARRGSGSSFAMSRE